MMLHLSMIQDMGYLVRNVFLLDLKSVNNALLHIRRSRLYLGPTTSEDGRQRTTNHSIRSVKPHHQSRANMPQSSALERISIRWLPEAAYEDTKTIAINVGEYFIDLRVTKKDSSIQIGRAHV